MRNACMPWPGVLPEPGLPNGRKIGYARVSTSDQRLDLQLDALTRAGCDLVFQDHGISGAKDKRPGLDRALAELCEGDILVVYKLDRLGRSVRHLTTLMEAFEQQNIHFCTLTEGINTNTPGGRLVYHLFASMSEFVRDLISENTVNGLAAARARGAIIGRPKKLAMRDVKELQERRQDGWTLDQLAAAYEVSLSTIQRHLKAC